MADRRVRPFAWNRTIFIVVALLAGCQSKMPLMPTPVALKDPRLDVFAANPAPLESNEFRSFYVTSRTPAGGSSKSFFTSKPDDYLHFGHATMRIGPPGFDIAKLMAASTTAERDEKLEWTVVDAPIDASVDQPMLKALTGTGDSAHDLPPDLQTFLEELNQAIDRSLTRSLTVYAHGANNSFLDSLPRGAQFQYFTGNNETLLTFAWPSPGSITGYDTDKARADASAEDFADLLVLLARYSTAERINIIGYSAGGRVSGGGLGLLGRRDEDPEAFRIGQVYLTASDQPMRKFLEDLPAIYSVVGALTVTADPGDSVLMLARATDTRMRVGAPVRDSVVDAFDLTEDQGARLKEMMNSEKMNFIDLSRNDIQGFRFSHGAWYENPWVSTDALVFILDRLTPSERGLKSYVSDLEFEIWYFPEDYLDRLKARLLESAR